MAKAICVLGVVVDVPSATTDGPEAAQYISDKFSDGNDDTLASGQNAALNLLGGASGGLLASSLTVSSERVNDASLPGSSNSVQIDLSAPLVATDSVSIGSVTITWVVGAPANENEVEIGGTDAECASNLAAAINNHSQLSVFIAQGDGVDTCQIQCTALGTVGNLIPLARVETNPGAMVLGGAFFGGVTGARVLGATLYGPLY